MTDLTAVGIHVFAGAFCRGVQDAGWAVDTHLETHGFGLQTAQYLCNVETINDKDARWPDKRALMAFGNPRCTAFSTITAGETYTKNNSHGAWAKQTCDLHQFMDYATNRFDFLVWESVQQAYKIGRPLVDYFVRTHCKPNNYRVAHVFINAATFGNAQQRKRYFFVAYRDCYKFNILPPAIDHYYATLYDAIWHMQDRPTRPCRVWDRNETYDADCYTELTPDEYATMPRLPNGFCLNQLGRYAPHLLAERYQEMWHQRASDMPFSLHGMNRLQWLRPSPTIHSSAGRWIHPTLHRPLTIGEIAAIMGWPKIPIEANPVALIAKGVVPAVGAWLAEQVRLSYVKYWGNEDWESSFDDRTATWVGGDTSDKLEKTFDMTCYVGKLFDLERYHEDARIPRYRLDVDRRRLPLSPLGIER